MKDQMETGITYLRNVDGAPFTSAPFKEINAGFTTPERLREFVRENEPQYAPWDELRVMDANGRNQPLRDFMAVDEQPEKEEGYTVSLRYTYAEEESPKPMPLRIHIRDAANGQTYTIQARHGGGITISVDASLHVRPGASNLIHLTAEY
jgi:hypothetical protein